MAALIAICCLISTPTAAQDYDAVQRQATAFCNDWVSQKRDVVHFKCRTPLARSFLEVLAQQREYHGDDKFDVVDRSPVCAPLNAVGIRCNYAVRHTLATFLAIWGEGNPFPLPTAGWSHNSYGGTVEQNRILYQALVDNQHLFADGDLTAEEVTNEWQWP